MSHIELVLWAGLTIGLVFGASGQATGFCLHRGLVQRWSAQGGYKLQAFALALAVALLGTQSLAALQLVDLSDSLYLTPRYSRSEEHTSELQSRENLVCRLLLE